MSEYLCNNCGQFKHGNHECPPCWQAVRPDYGDPDDETTFYKAFGHDAEDAALDIAQRKFSDWDHPREFEIWVRENQADEWSKFEITVEAVPSFSASPV